MRGSIDSYETDDGTRWRIRYELPPDPKTGKRRQRARRGFDTEKDAERALVKAVGSVHDGTFVDPSKLTVTEWALNTWLTRKKPKAGRSGRGHRGQVSLSTWDTYGTTLEAYVIPHIGHVRLQQLTREHLNDLYDHLEENGGRSGDGLSAKTVSNVHGVIHKALEDAVKAGKVVRNVADAVEPPKADKAQTDVWTVPQLRAFLSSVTDDRLYAMWLLFSTTGMRRGEVAGLSWGDVDLDAGTLRVSWTLGVVGAKATFKRRAKSKAGERTMSLDPTTVDALRAWKAQQNRERLASGGQWTETNVDWRGNERNGLVFTWPDGTLINPERITRWFTDHAADAGLPHIRLHDVRHTYATAGLAAAEGWSEIKTISERLGHKSVGITLDTYSHALPSMDEKVANTLARVILGQAG